MIGSQRVQNALIRAGRSVAVQARGLVFLVTTVIGDGHDIILVGVGGAPGEH